MATKKVMSVKVKTDKNEPGKKPKPMAKPAMSTRGKAKVSPAATNKALGRASDSIGKPHPVTGKPITKAQAVQVERQKEYKKNS